MYVVHRSIFWRAGSPLNFGTHETVHVSTIPDPREGQAKIEALLKSIPMLQRRARDSKVAVSKTYFGELRLPADGLPSSHVSAPPTVSCECSGNRGRADVIVLVQMYPPTTIYP